MGSAARGAAIAQLVHVARRALRSLALVAALAPEAVAQRTGRVLARVAACAGVMQQPREDEDREEGPEREHPDGEPLLPPPPTPTRPTRPRTRTRRRPWRTPW